MSIFARFTADFISYKKLKAGYFSAKQILLSRESRLTKLQLYYLRHFKDFHPNTSFH